MTNFNAFNQGVAQGAGAVNDAQRERLKARQARQEAAQKEAESLAGQYNKKAQGDLYSAQAREVDVKVQKLQFELNREREKGEKRDQIAYNDFAFQALESRHFGKIAKLMDYDPERTQALLAEKNYASLPQPIDFVNDHDLLVDAGMPEASLNPNDPNTGRVRAYAAKNLFKVLKTDGTYEINSFNNANIALGFTNRLLKEELKFRAQEEARWARGVAGFDYEAETDETRAKTEFTRAQITGDVKPDPTTLSPDGKREVEIEALMAGMNEDLAKVEGINLESPDWNNPEVRKSADKTMRKLITRGQGLTKDQVDDIKPLSQLAYLLDIASRLPDDGKATGPYASLMAWFQKFLPGGVYAGAERGAFSGALNLKVKEFAGSAATVGEVRRTYNEFGSLLEGTGSLLQKLELQAGQGVQGLEAVLSASNNPQVAAFQLGTTLESMQNTYEFLKGRNSGDGGVPENDKANREAWKITNPGEPYPGDE